MACSNVNAKKAGCLFFLFESQCGGGNAWKKQESELQKEKDKITSKKMVFQHLSLCATSSVYLTLYSANYMFIKMHFLSMEDKISVVMTTSPE